MLGLEPGRAGAQGREGRENAARRVTGTRPLGLGRARRCWERAMGQVAPRSVVRRHRGQRWLKAARPWPATTTPVYKTHTAGPLTSGQPPV
jgi:hypothetical protein